MKKLISLFLVLLALTSCETTEAPMAPERISLFEMGEDGSKFYRIPALVKAADGALVAVADKRGDALGDLPNIITIVSKRSTDGGKTWSDMSIVAKGDTVAKCGYGDAVVIADEVKGYLVAVFSGNNGLWHSNESSLIRTYASTSTDSGKTWGEVKDITDQVYGGVYGEGTRHGLFTGSGSGVQLKHGEHAGRLMLVVAARNDASWGGTLSNYAVYSDDGGQSWQVSKNAACTNGDEAKVVELNNGDILMSIRTAGKRWYNISHDGGITWNETTSEWDDLIGPACNGDLIRYDENTLLHSLPKGDSRRDVAIYISKDEGKTWNEGKVIVPRYSAYSSLCVLPDKTIGMFVEEREVDTTSYEMVFYRFPIEYLEAMNQ